MFGMKKGPILEKKDKKKDSVRVQITKANQKLMKLETKFRSRLRTEVNTVKESRRKKKENPRAEARLKNSYYCLQLVYVAMERMEDIEGTYELTSAMNELSTAMKLVNGLEGKADSVNTLLLRFRTKRLKENAGAAATGGMREYFKENIDELVDDSVLEDLISGKSIDDILNDDISTIEAVDDLLNFCDEYSQDLDDAGVKSAKDYEDGLKMFDDFIDKL